MAPEEIYPRLTSGIYMSAYMHVYLWIQEHAYIYTCEHTNTNHMINTRIIIILYFTFPVFTLINHQLICVHMCMYACKCPCASEHIQKCQWCLAGADPLLLPWVLRIALRPSGLVAGEPSHFPSYTEHLQLSPPLPLSICVLNNNHHPLALLWPAIYGFPPADWNPDPDTEPKFHNLSQRFHP